MLRSLYTAAKGYRAHVLFSVKNIVAGILGRDHHDYSGHSFRRGGTTAMYEAGVLETLIAMHGRWRSLAYRKSLEFTDVDRVYWLSQLCCPAPLPKHASQRHFVLIVSVCSLTGTTENKALQSQSEQIPKKTKHTVHSER